MSNNEDREFDEVDPPTFFEDLQAFLEKLNEAFPGTATLGRRHNVTLDANGNLEIVVWTIDAAGNPTSWFISMDTETDLFQSMDDVIVDLRKYIDKNAK